MVNEKSWEEFKDSGLLWFVNQSLHVFGWAITVEGEYEGDEFKVFRAYPARVKFRGFDSASTEKGYRQVTKYMADEVQILLEEAMD